ncbi:unnamed protein product [Linum tenue]|uniref:Spindle and kinetochore-associated protein 3 n=1 Tax=Linum tenue TaxID=586396 RepID=A0AAV0J112_9ROSI|nr:unnamed protein product [Linum tenue]
MEEVIYAFGKSLGSFCNSLQASCDGLKQSIERRPVPLDPASTTFIRNLNRRLSAAGRDLNHLESMSFGTVSLEELLGHCNEVYKKNQSDVLEIEDQLRSYGYVPEVENDDDDQDRALESELNDDGPFNSSSPDLEPGKNAVVKILDEEDPLYPNYQMSIHIIMFSSTHLVAVESKYFKTSIDMTVVIFLGFEES